MTTPDQSRVYFPVRRQPRLTMPPVGAPTLAEIVWAYWDDLDYPESPNPTK